MSVFFVPTLGDTSEENRTGDESTPKDEFEETGRSDPSGKREEGRRVGSPVELQVDRNKEMYLLLRDRNGSDEKTKEDTTRDTRVLK